jgi:hypothetical protein
MVALLLDIALSHREVRVTRECTSLLLVRQPTLGPTHWPSAKKPGNISLAIQARAQADRWLCVKFKG